MQPAPSASSISVAAAPLLTVQADLPEKDDTGPTVGLTGMTVNLVTGGLGSGILTLAWGMAGASIVWGVLLIVLVVALNGCTVMLLVHAAEAHQKFDLGALLAMLPGRWLGPGAQGACNALVWVTLWMTLVGYVIVVQDCLTSLFPAGSPLALRWVWAVLSSAVALCLSLMDLQFLSWTSSPLSVAVNCYLFGLLCTSLTSSGVSPDGPCLIAKVTPPPRGVFAFLSLISVSVIIQMCILPMYKELEDRSPRRFRRALGTSFSILAVLYSAFATIAYLRFGPAVPDNVLNDLGGGGWDEAARIGMSVVVLCVYPIMVKPMVAPVEGLLAARSSGSEGGGEGGEGQIGRRCGALAVKAAAVVIVGSVMVCAFFVHDLGLMSVIGGTVSVGGFVALSPGLVGLYLSDHKHGLCWRVAMHILIWGGLALSVLGIFYSQNYADELGEKCAWKL